MDTRRCIGSAKFGIEAHDAPPGDFPSQPSQKDGLGRMCKPHWREYTNALRKAALARKAADADPAVGKLASARQRGAAIARDAKPAIRPVPKRATKQAPARTRPAPAARRTADQPAVEAVDDASGRPEPRPIAPGRLSEADGHRISALADAAREAADIEEGSIA